MPCPYASVRPRESSVASRDSPNPPPTTSATGPWPFGRGSGRRRPGAPRDRTASRGIRATRPPRRSSTSPTRVPDRHLDAHTRRCSMRSTPRPSFRSLPSAPSRPRTRAPLADRAPVGSRACRRTRRRPAQAQRADRAAHTSTPGRTRRRLRASPRTGRARSATSALTRLLRHTRASAVTPEVWQPLGVTEISSRAAATSTSRTASSGTGPSTSSTCRAPYTHLEINWELPQFRRYCERLAEFTRLILFDKRGMGMSDRVAGATTLEERMDDIRAIMDAIGSEPAAVMGESEGGPLAMLFAAAHPERTVALILQGGEVRERTDDGLAVGREHGGGASRRRWRRCRSAGETGSASTSSRRASRVRSGRGRGAAACRCTANTPAAAEAFMRMAFDIDVRHVVPTINVPTLIVHAVGDQVCHVENARFLARTIPELDVRRVAGRRARPLVRSRRDDRRDPRVPHRDARGEHAGSGARDGAVHRPRRLDGACGGDRRPRWRDLARAASRRRPPRARALRRSRGRHGGRRLLRHLRRPGARDPLRAGDRRGRAAARPRRSRRAPHRARSSSPTARSRGIAVNIGARVAGTAGAGEVLVSGTVKDLVAGSGLEFEDRGVATLKGIPGEWRLFAVVD